MSFKDTIIQGVLESLAPLAIELIQDQIPTIREFLLDQAKKTDNELDDHLVISLCEWFEQYLDEVLEEL